MSRIILVKGKLKEKNNFPTCSQQFTISAVKLNCVLQFKILFKLQKQMYITTKLSK